MVNQCLVTFGSLTCCLEDGHEGMHQHPWPNNNLLNDIREGKTVRCRCGAGSLFTPDCICSDDIEFT